MEITTVVFFVSLFVMLTSAILTERMGSRRMSGFYLGSFFLNAICFLYGVAMFMLDGSMAYMVGGMVFSLAALSVTCYKNSVLNVQ